MSYQHTWLDGSAIEYPVGKAVCVGRNYVAHAEELNNPVPSAPLLFIKPNTALCRLGGPLAIPVDRGQVHHELEIAVLIGKTLTNVSESEAWQGVAGIGLGLDLTLRDLQSTLKRQGHPWERAKAFDNSCPVSSFAKVNPAIRDANLAFSMAINGDIRQAGDSANMIWPTAALIAEISRSFTLLPGDIVLTGTPEGVGPLVVGDKIELSLMQTHTFTAEVVASE